MSDQIQANNFHTASAAFLDSLPTSKEPTRQTYAAALAAFAQYLQQAKELSLDTPPTNYPEKILLDFFLWLDRRGYSSFTLNTYLAALRRFLLFHYTARNLGPEFDIVRAQNLLKGKLKLHYPQTKAPDDLPSLVLYYDQQPLPSASGGKEARLQHLCLLRDRAILHTLYATVGRVSEVATVTRQDVAEGETDEVLITGKGDKEQSRGSARHAAALRAAQRAGLEQSSIWLRFRKLWRMHGTAGRQGHQILQAAGLRGNGGSHYDPIKDF